ncbi:hypothetical protein SDC9_204239 [bioreactor metagenome]|uniref:Uncharacterized protein n=1 Tax=bioreactor metagenome TaxID=1076179 RepID=A0A645J1G4_9ZZZZ
MTCNKDDKNTKVDNTVQTEILEGQIQAAATSSFDLMIDEFIQSLSAEEYQELAIECRDYFVKTGKREQANFFKPDQLSSPVHAGILRSYIEEHVITEKEKAI